MKTARRINDRKTLLKYAKTASINAKRSSIALNIPFEIIKDGNLYQVYDGSMIKTATIRKIESKKNGFTKGSKICLK